MVEINHKIIITAVLCLTLIEMLLIIFDHDSSALSTLIIGVIAMSAGIMIKSPLIDNKTGVLYYGRRKPTVRYDRTSETSG